MCKLTSKDLDANHRYDSEKKIQLSPKEKNKGNNFGNFLQIRFVYFFMNSNSK